SYVRIAVRIASSPGGVVATGMRAPLSSAAMSAITPGGGSDGSSVAHATIAGFGSSSATRRSSSPAANHVVTSAVDRSSLVMPAIEDVAIAARCPTPPTSTWSWPTAPDTRLHRPEADGHDHIDAGGGSYFSAFALLRTYPRLSDSALKSAAFAAMSFARAASPAPASAPASWYSTRGSCWFA